MTIDKSETEIPGSVADRMINLRLLHLRECAEIWSESESIENFIITCNEKKIDFRWQDPLDETVFDIKFKDKAWVKFLKAYGPKKAGEPVKEGNPYLFWYEGIPPFYNPSNSSMILQPYINNRIIIKVPKKQNVKYFENGQIVESEECLTGFQQAIALTNIVADDPALFSAKQQSNQNLTYKSGAETMYTLDLSEKEYNINTGLFVADSGRYSVYFSPAYKEYRKLFDLPPIVPHDPTQLIPEILAPEQPEKSFNLDNNSSGLYFSLSAGLRNLLTTMWTNDSIWDLAITTKERLEQHKPGQTVKLINDLLDTTYPLHFDLVIMEDEHAHYVLDKDTGKGSWIWIYSEDFVSKFKEGSDIKAGVAYPTSKLPLQMIEYTIPTPPQNESMAPIALMNYDVDDYGMPFTC
ncbi:hypothetical protein [Psychromonas aquimarina]|uniref:hypothetical protein n=1 Tax=Psychromonas aquimarina TaxID=444919 RepID=UPI00040FBA03|nr:hypothetical protein [Psychromonas aquimarina]